MLNCLNHFAYQDAIFLSERLHSECKFFVVYFLTFFQEKIENKIDNMPKLRLFKLFEALLTGIERNLYLIYSKTSRTESD